MIDVEPHSVLRILIRWKINPAFFRLRMQVAMDGRFGFQSPLIAHNAKTTTKSLSSCHVAAELLG
jgi:hypothetical protein